MFGKYAKQLRDDLDAIISHDDDSSKIKKKSQSSNNSKDPREKKLEDAFRQVMYCLQPAVRSGITVFDLNSDNSLSETIFRSICKCKLIVYLEFFSFNSSINLLST